MNYNKEYSIHRLMYFTGLYYCKMSKDPQIFNETRTLDAALKNDVDARVHRKQFRGKFSFYKDWRDRSDAVYGVRGKIRPRTIGPWVKPVKLPSRCNHDDMESRGYFYNVLFDYTKELPIVDYELCVGCERMFLLLKKN